MTIVNIFSPPFNSDVCVCACVFRMKVIVMFVVYKSTDDHLSFTLEEDKNSQAISGYDYEGWERLDTDAMIK